MAEKSIQEVLKELFSVEALRGTKAELDSATQELLAGPDWDKLIADAKYWKETSWDPNMTIEGWAQNPNTEPWQKDIAGALSLAAIYGIPIGTALAVPAAGVGTAGYLAAAALGIPAAAITAGGLKTGYNWLKDEGLPAVGNWAEDTWDNFTNSTKQTVDNIADFTKDATNTYVTKPIQKVGSDIAAGANKVSNWAADNVVNPIETGLQNAGNWLQDTTSKAVNWTKDNTEAAAKNLSDWFGNMTSNVKGLFNKR